jgi:DNA-binding MarR family transcriptional regulator
MGRVEGGQPGREGFSQSWRAAVIELAISYAVNHPIRLDCLAILIIRVASAKEIAEELGINVPSVAHHLEGLYKDGVIEYVKSETGGSRRAASEHFYRATALPEVTEEDWLKMPPDCRRQMAGRVLQAIVALSLSAMRCQTMEEDNNLFLGWQAIPVDDQGEDELTELLAETSQREMEIKARAAERLTESGQTGRVRVVANMGFWQADPGEWAGRLRGE